MATFSELGISPALLNAIQKMGFEEATPIQSETIPVALEGKDVIGQAQTGTGKTAAFGIPLLEKITVGVRAVQAVIIAPTRELAIQVSEELYRIGGTFKGVKILPIYGGQDINRQSRWIKNGPQETVATQGRLLDHMNRKTIRLGSVQTVVLDEADEMLNMGFIDDIKSILAEVPKEHQTLLFSATMPPQIRAMADQFMMDPVHVKVKAKEMTVPKIRQYYIEIQERRKFDVLTRLLDIESPELAIVFGRTKRRVDELTEALNLRGYAAEGIHGDLSQAKRMSVLRKFKEGTIEILVATDVAARGLDISGVTHVFNFDIPQDPESYVHRIGRTGRAGKEGWAVAFITPREFAQLKNIEKVTKRKMDKLMVPTLDQAIEGQQRITVEKVNSTIETENFLAYQNVAEELLQENDALTVISACLKLLTREPDQTPVKLTEEAPIFVKRDRRNTGSNRKGRNSERRRFSTSDRSRLRTHNQSHDRTKRSSRSRNSGKSI